MTGGGWRFAVLPVVATTAIVLVVVGATTGAPRPQHLSPAQPLSAVNAPSQPMAGA